MAFYLKAEDSGGNELPEVSLSHGVLVYWAEKAEEYNLPIIAGMYDVAFSEGFHIYDEKLDQLKKEAYQLYSFLENEGHERSIFSNLMALEKFRKALDKANREIWIS